MLRANQAENQLGLHSIAQFQATLNRAVMRQSGDAGATMSRGGSNSSTFWILREFAACLRLCQLMSTAVTPLAAAGAGSAEKGRATKLRTTFLMACAGLVLSIACCVQASAATRHVVLLFDERVELPGLSLLDKELASTLRASSTERVEIYREAMDLSRFSSYSYKTVLRDRLPPTTKLIFARKLLGNGIGGKLRSLARLSLFRPGLSRFCCMNIIDDAWPRCRCGSAWQNLPTSTASRPLVN